MIRMISYVTTSSREQNRISRKHIQYVALMCCCSGFVAMHSNSVSNRSVNSGINIGSLRHEHDDNVPQTLEQGDLLVRSHTKLR